MPTIKLTQKAVDRMRAPDPNGKQVLVWDRDLKGLGVLVSGTTNAKSYVVQGALRGGKTRRVTVGPTNVMKLDAAIIKAKEILALFYAGKDPKHWLGAADPTLQEALDGYIEDNNSLGSKSADDYRNFIETHLADWLASRISTITTDMVRERHAKIAKEIAERTKDQKIVRTGHGAANATMRCLRAIYNHARDRNKDLPENPVRGLKRSWFKIRRRTRLVKFDQLADFYAAIGSLENEVVADYVRFVLFTGTRRGEAAGLRWDAIDFGAKTILFKGEDVKNGDHFKLPMSDVVSDLLVARRARGVVGDYVFPANSESGHIEEPKSSFAEIAEASGIKVSPHDLRRTFETVAESCDLSPYALKALINHRLPQESQNDVTGGYVIMSTERLRHAAQTVADRLKELCGIEPVEAAADNVARLRQS